MNTEILEDIGLSKAEITTYVALLELGASTSGPVINRAKLQSSVVHRAIKTLIEKGLVTYVKIGKDNQYQAAEPNNLLNYVETKKRQLKEILPLLEQKRIFEKEKNDVEMFLGKRAMFTMLNNLIKDARAKEEYLSFSLIEAHSDEELIQFYKRYNALRQEKKLLVKVLVNKKVKSIYEKNYSKELLKRAQVKYTNFEFPQGITIFRDSIIFLSWSVTPVAVKITNKTIAEQFKTFFLGFYNTEKGAY